MDVSVIGTGRVGTAHAATLAALGHRVLGIDVDADQVRMLRDGRTPYAEPGLAELLREGRDCGRLDFDTDLARAAAEAEVHFLCVGTPSHRAHGGHDLGALEAVVAELTPRLTRPSLLVGRSTVPVGTAEALAGLVRDKEAEPGRVEVAWNPEFLREGHAVEDSLHPHRIVLGTASREAGQRLRELYDALVRAGTPVIETSLPTAELAKASANVMLAARVSLVNVMAEVCEAAGGDVEDLVEVLGGDPRIGRDFLRAGLGYGGSCLPKDLRGYVARAEELGLTEPARLLVEVDRVNRRQRTRTVELARELLAGSSTGPLTGCRVAVLGAAFKAGVDDVRESPALAVVEELHAAGARVTVHDPAALPAARRELPGPAYVDDVESACRDAELVLLLTDWDCYAALDPGRLAALVSHPRLLDARLIVDAGRWRRAGWQVRALGRPA